MGKLAGAEGVKEFKYLSCAIHSLEKKR